MIKFFRQLYLPDRFFFAGAVLVALFAFSFAFPWLFPLAELAVLALVAATIVDVVLLFNQKVRLEAKRYLPNLLSLGDENAVRIEVTNHYQFPLQAVLIDELPYQLQRRDFSMSVRLPSADSRQLTYRVRPVVRGEYAFGKLHLYLTTILGLIKRRYSFDLEQTVAVYPSVLQLKKYQLKAFDQFSHFHGIRKMRRIGHSYEFEQIKEYVRGDDYRSINWKATSRRNKLMVNQYEDERAQQIYSVIDKSRSMQLPFNKMILMDYAINTSLVISNITLQKHDKAGLLTFSDRINNVVKAENSRTQLKKILETLYNQQANSLEADYERWYQAVKRYIKNRSLLFLYTNFESYYALERILPILQKINQLHLLVVMFFENPEVEEFIQGETETLKDIYFQTIARDFVYEKEEIQNTLRKHGILTMINHPEALSVNSVNKYLELKARGMI